MSAFRSVTASRFVKHVLRVMSGLSTTTCTVPFMETETSREDTNLGCVQDANKVREAVKTRYSGLCERLETAHSKIS